MSFKLSEEIVDALLKKLGSDDAFRDLFQENPRKALASLGHQAALKASDADEGIWMCMTTSKLANKEAIRASHDELRKQLLTSQAGQHPITLQV